MTRLLIRKIISSVESSATPSIEQEQNDDSYSTSSSNDFGNAQLKTTTSSIESEATAIESTSVMATTTIIDGTPLPSVETTLNAPMPAPTNRDEEGYDIPSNTSTTDNEENYYTETTDASYTNTADVPSITTLVETIIPAQQPSTATIVVTTIIGSSDTASVTPTSCNLSNVATCSQTVSANSATENLSKNDSSSLNVGQVIGIVVGIVVFLVLAGAFCFLYRRKKHKQEKYVSRVSPFMFLPDEDESTIIKSFTEKDSYTNNFITNSSNNNNNELPDDAVFYSSSTSYRRGSNHVRESNELSIATPEKLYSYYKYKEDDMSSHSLYSHMSQINNNNRSLSNKFHSMSTTITNNRTTMNSDHSNSGNSYTNANRQSSNDHHASLSSKCNIYKPYLSNSLLLEEEVYHQNKTFTSGHQRQESSLDPQLLQEEQDALSMWDDNLITSRFH